MKGFQDKSVIVSHVFGNFDSLEWFANQVPYNISGNNVDLILYHRSRSFDGIEARYKITIVEMKKDTAGIEDFHQLLGYCQWAGEQLAEREHYLVQPVLLANDFDPSLFRLIDDLRLAFKEPQLIRYRYDHNGLRLEPAKHPSSIPTPIEQFEQGLDPERLQKVLKRRNILIDTARNAERIQDIW